MLPGAEAWCIVVWQGQFPTETLARARRGWRGEGAGFKFGQPAAWAGAESARSRLLAEGWTMAAPGPEPDGSCEGRLKEEESRVGGTWRSGSRQGHAAGPRMSVVKPFSGSNRDGGSPWGREGCSAWCQPD